MSEPPDVTRILKSLELGHSQAAEQLLPMVYDELRKLAAARMSVERPDHTLQATALVHEAYLRLVKVSSGQVWEGRHHFFAAAAEAMRRIVIDAARARRSLRKGGGWKKSDLDSNEPAAPVDDERILAIDQYLEQLQQIDGRAATIVKLRLYAGMSISEAAESLGVSRTTAYQDWAYGRAWLKSHVGEVESQADAN